MKYNVDFDDIESGFEIWNDSKVSRDNQKRATGRGCA